MKSIRRTLLLNILLLLVVTLGVVTYVVYSTAVDALREKEHAAQELVEVRYNDQLDEELRNRADHLARDVQQNFQVEKMWLRWLGAEAAAVASPVNQYGQVPLLIALSQSVHHPITYWQNGRFATELTLNEDEIYRHNPEAGGHEFIQMVADWGASWSSKSLSGLNVHLDVAAVPHIRTRPPGSTR